MSKNLIDKYNQKLLNHAKQFATDEFKTAPERVIKKNSRSDWWFGNKIADKITKISKTLPHNNSEIVTNIGLDREIPRERYISPEKRQKIIDVMIQDQYNSLIMDYQKKKIVR